MARFTVGSKDRRVKKKIDDGFFFISLFSFFFPLLEKRMKLKYIFYTRV